MLESINVSTLIFEEVKFFKAPMGEMVALFQLRIYWWNNNVQRKSIGRNEDIYIWQGEGI